MTKEERELLLANTILIENIAGTVISNERMLINIMDIAYNKNNALEDMVKEYRKINDEKFAQIRDLMEIIGTLIEKMTEEDGK